LAEDDSSLGFVIKDNLEVEGFEVVWKENGEDALLSFKNQTFDLCILDIMMPRKDGFSLAKEIRQKDDLVPLIFLTAKSMEEDRVKGFEIGADDYVVKPFSMTELTHRIKRLLKRSGITKKTGASVSIGKYVFEPYNQKLNIEGEEIDLTYMEAQLIEMLCSNRNTNVKREDILVKIWGENDYFKGRSLDVFISRLRKYFSRDPTIEIKNIHGVGFMMRC
jgi:DNA-binding response OmpR family regulator